MLPFNLSSLIFSSSRLFSSRFDIAYSYAIVIKLIGKHDPISKCWTNIGHTVCNNSFYPEFAQRFVFAGVGHLPLRGCIRDLTACSLSSSPALILAVSFPAFSCSSKLKLDTDSEKIKGTGK